MDARGRKRNHIEIMENEFTAECTKLGHDSENLNKDMKATRENFALMYKSMNDRHAELLTHGLFLEEQHRRVLDVLDGRPHGPAIQSTGVNETLTIADVRKLAQDCDETLRNHRIIREIEIQEMEKVFKQYKAVMKQNIVGFREMAEGIEKQRRELSPKLIQFARAVVEETA